MIRRHEAHVVLSFDSHDESGEWDDWADGDGHLAGLISLRADILAGDYRALYLGWLLAVQDGQVEDGQEPPVPPGLAEPSASLKALAEFLRIDDDLLAAAAQASGPAPERTSESPQQWLDWIRSLSDADRERWLLQTARGDSSVHHEMQRQFRQHCSRRQPPVEVAQARRTVEQLIAAWNELTEQRHRRLAEERARKAREKATARKQFLDDLASRADTVRAEIDTLIQTKQPKSYDRAVQLLKDLRDATSDQPEAFGTYLATLRRDHARRPSLIHRLDQAHL